MDSFSSHIILPQLNLILTQHQGRLKMKDLILSTRKFIEDKRYNPNMDLLIDFTDSIAISYRLDLFEFIDFFKKSVRLKERIKVCIVYSSPNQEFLLKTYKPMAKLLNMEVEIFKDMQLGLNWLNFSNEQNEILLENLLAIKDQSGNIA